MRRIAVALSLLICIASGIAQENKKGSTGQTRPDLSGTWLVNERESSKPGMFGAMQSNQKSSGDTKYLIEHHDPEIKVTMQFCHAQECVTLDEKRFYTDERGEQNVDRTGRSVNSITRWDGKKIVTKFPGKSANYDGFMKWELSKDGKKLTRTITGPNIPSAGGGDTSLRNFLTNSRTVLVRS
ncbi:MAG: hypothetical protein JO360_09765 [Acidobacteria bacterium]|nr:hypothetical protein [Acidobacteriota bacterium]